MNIDKEYLCRVIENLKEQKQELTDSRDNLNTQIIEVKGAMKWVKQTIKLLDSSP